MSKYDTSERIIQIGFSPIADSPEVLTTLAKSVYYNVFDKISNEEVIVVFPKDIQRFNLPRQMFRTRGYLKFRDKVKSYLFIDNLNDKEEKQFKEQNPELFI